MGEELTDNPKRIEQRREVANQAAELRPGHTQAAPD